MMADDKKMSGSEAGDKKEAFLARFGKKEGRKHSKRGHRKSGRK
jgi:hypothetical protein